MPPVCGRRGIDIGKNRPTPCRSRQDSTGALARNPFRLKFLVSVRTGSENSFQQKPAESTGEVGSAGAFVL